MTRPERRILFVGNGPYLNHGCEAIVRGTTTILRRKFGDDIEFVNALFAAPNTLRDQNAGEIDRSIRSITIEKPESLTKGFTGKVLRKLSIPVPDRLSAMTPFLDGTKVALELGGDMYSLCYGLWVLRRYMNLDRFLWKHNLPVVLWGASVGPFSEHPEVEAEMAEHLKRLSLVLVRETESYEYLKSIGVDDNLRLVADPAFAMSPAEPGLVDDLAEFISAKPIGVNVSALVANYRNSGSMSWEEVAEDYLRSLLGSQDSPVLLVPHVTVPGHNDHDFMKRVLERIPEESDRLRLLPGSLGAAEYKWVIARLRALVAARTHATIAGFSSGVPTLSIAYSVKAVGLNKDIYGHTGWCLPVAECTAEAMLEKTRQLLSEEESLRKQLADAAEVMRNRAHSAADHLETVIGREW